MNSHPDYSFTHFDQTRPWEGYVLSVDVKHQSSTTTYDNKKLFFHQYEFLGMTYVSGGRNPGSAIGQVELYWWF